MDDKNFSEKAPREGTTPPEYSDVDIDDIVHTDKTWYQRIVPAFACGAGLFSDGYLQSVIGPCITILEEEYPKATLTASGSTKPVISDLAAIAFVGTVVGQLFFGFTSDRYSRKWSLMASTIILFVFAALGAGAYGAGGSHSGTLSALIAYRFLVGIGIGGEYPAGSVSCAEATGELKEGTRNRWFILFTNFAIDVGFTVGSLIPMAIAAGSPNNLGLIWRLSLGLACVFPLSLVYLRWQFEEPEATKREAFRKGRTPYWLAFKFYMPRLLLVMGIWFIYDFLTYPFSIFSTSWIDTLDPTENLWQTFGWGALVNFFYVPGALIGTVLSDWMGPRRALMTFVTVQGCIGFIMAGCYKYLRVEPNIPAFVIIYGVFLMVGEMGPGDNIGLIAAKTCATGVRGKYYAIAAATGKLGAYVGDWIFPLLESAGGKSGSVGYGQVPFFFASGLCFLSAFLVFWLPNVEQNTIEFEDKRFREYLIANGWDVSDMGADPKWRDIHQEEMRRASVH